VHGCEWLSPLGMVYPAVHGLLHARCVPAPLRPRQAALCAAFVGTVSSKTCPLSYFRLETEAACQSLADIGGKLYAGSVNVASFPPGCFWFKVGGGVYLNTNTNGGAHLSAQLLCAGAPNPAPPSHA
jgi:hypothetical protein